MTKDSKPKKSKPAKRAHAGRPPVHEPGQTDRRSHRYRIDQCAQWQAAADQLGISLNAWVNAACNEKLKAQLGEDS